MSEGEAAVIAREVCKARKVYAEVGEEAVAVTVMADVGYIAEYRADEKFAENKGYAEPEKALLYELRDAGIH